MCKVPILALGKIIVNKIKLTRMTFSERFIKHYTSHLRSPLDRNIKKKITSSPTKWIKSKPFSQKQFSQARLGLFFQIYLRLLIRTLQRHVWMFQCLARKSGDLGICTSYKQLRVTIKHLIFKPFNRCITEIHSND